MTDLPSHIRDEFETYVRKSAPTIDMRSRNGRYTEKTVNILWDMWVYAYHFGLDEGLSSEIDVQAHNLDKYTSMADRARNLKKTNKGSGK